MAAIERTVQGLHYELVDVERAPGGLLRVTIDRLPGAVYEADAGGSAGDAVSVDDCELVTRQLQYVLTVEDVDYRRLEVSSPGLDRPLRKPAHYERFAGERVSLALKAPLDGRKHFQGRLETRDGGWRLALERSDGTGAASGEALDFTLDEVREARLVPVFDFKGRRRPEAAPDAEAVAGDRKE